MVMNTEKNWHARDTQTVIQHFESDLGKGLGAQEVASRLKQFGENRITPKEQQGAFVRFMLQFHQPLIYILLGATLVTVLLGEYIDAAVIFAVVLINSIIGYVQETKALKAIDALSKSMVLSATVRRDGKTIEIDGVNLVPGDIVVIQSGDKIPADIRLLKLRDLKIDESALTGESVSVEKSIATVEEEAILGDRTNMGFATTVVTYGTATGIVVSTGDHTEVGKISQSISSAVERKSTSIMSQLN
jgi:cation-transporting P-type ATPase F